MDVDFRAMIRYEQLLFAPDIPAADKVERLLRLLFPSGYGGDKTAAWNALRWYHRCGQDTLAADRSEHHPARRAYDWEQDSCRIVAAFQQAYGIDLTSTKLHWWYFRALFDNLPADCRLCKIMEYRVADTASLPEKTRAFYEKMRQLYSLDRLVAPNRKMTVEEHDALFIARLRREG